MEESQEREKELIEFLGKHLKVSLCQNSGGICGSNLIIKLILCGKVISIDNTYIR